MIKSLEDLGFEVTETHAIWREDNDIQIPIKAIQRVKDAKDLTSVLLHTARDQGFEFAKNCYKDDLEKLKKQYDTNVGFKPKKV